MSTAMTLDPLAAVNAIDKIECGKDAAKHFSFKGGYRNLNHGMLALSERWIELQSVNGETG